MLAWIGQRKDELADVTTAARQAAQLLRRDRRSGLRRYQRQLQEDDAVDFDDLLMRAVELFEQHPEVLAKYQGRWQQILVDEYQDTNRAQYLICSMLAGEAPQPGAWWATTTRASTPGAAPTCATSWTSRPTIPTPRS